MLLAVKILEMYYPPPNR